jgi:hypothetical protein
MLYPRNTARNLGCRNLKGPGYTHTERDREIDGWDGMEWDGMGWDEMGYIKIKIKIQINIKTR